MKIIKILTAALVLCGMLFLSLSCSSGSTTTSTTKVTTATVKTGNISVSITGTGNLAYSKTEKLAFDMAGYVEDVLVSVGDTVTEGQELVKLNTSDWQDQIKALEKKLTSAKRDLVSAEAAVGNKELAVSQAELDLETAQYNLNQISSVKTAQDKVDSYQADIDFAKDMLRAPEEDQTYWKERITALEKNLAEAQADLQSVLKGTNTTISTTVALQISQDQLKISQSESNVEAAKLAVTNAQLDMTDAESAVQDAQDALDEANSLSPIIKAPFAGYITKVNVSGGDEVFKGSVAVQISDPNEFEADILVTENDIYSVKVGGDATVSLDSLSGLTFPAKITKIAPTATVSSGVVNYDVVVTLTSLTPNNTAVQMPAQPPTGALPSGSFPTPTGAVQPSNTTGTGSASAAAASSSVALKDGLSATVEIISAQANNVLIIPSKAITTKGPTYTVQVVKGTATETRTVKIGITDGTNTVITDGLTSGEQVSYTVKSSSSSSSSSSSGNNAVIPGIGGGGPPPGGF
jgi:HlyD family secretion protein